jgi:shikimate dehydrogenase
VNTARTLLIVASPARDVVSARRDVAVSKAASADAMELRLDRWSPLERRRLSEMFPTELPLIATLRSRAQGGEGPDDPADRAQILDAAVAFPFAFVDYELGRDEPPATPPPGGVRSAAPAEIWSVHFPAETPGRTIVDAVAKRSKPPGFVKVVLPANLHRVWDEVLPLLPLAQAEKAVVHTTGGSGPLLRALAQHFGMPAVFCALPTPSNASDIPSESVEPAQIPVDRLALHFGSRGDPDPRFALLGHPVGRSRSPSLHSRWMAALGLHGVYVALDVETKAELAESLPQLARLGFRGVNVTRPWKTAAFELATTTSPAAEICGCANTLTLSGDRVEAENTDLIAVIRRFEGLRAAGRWDGAEVTVLGSGGAARAALAAAHAESVRATVVARNDGAARELAGRFGAVVRSPNDPSPAALLVHATPVGGNMEDELPFPVGPWLAPGGHVMDFVYGPERAVIAEAARIKSASYEDGSLLLVEQAAAAFELWWGVAPPRVELPVSSEAGG